MRRIVRSFLETSGYSPKETSGQGEKPQSFGTFFYKFFLPAAAIAGFGHWVGEISPLVASGLHIFALAVFLWGFLPWCNARWKTVLLGMAGVIAALLLCWGDYRWIKEEWTPSFIYFVPTEELFDCERRAFFVNHSGFKALRNLKITIKDEKSGAIQEVDDYSAGIEPGPQNPDVPRYVWVKPSHPWDEHYTINVTGTNFHSVQEMVLVSVKKNAQFAVEVTVDPGKKPIISCRDSLLPEIYSLSRHSKSNCDHLMAIDPRTLDKLDSQNYGFQRPNGDYVVTRLRNLPSPPDLESQPEDRHLTEYQRTIMKRKLSKYRGTKLLILYTGGMKTLQFATEFHDFFGSMGWQVQGPRTVPPGDEGLVDVQVSAGAQHWSAPYARALDLRASLEGVKHRQRIENDDAIPSDLVVLWVGPKSPENFKPDDCLAALFHPIAGQPHTCDAVAQSLAVCPFAPE